MSVLLTGIAELVTNDPEWAEGHADPGDRLLGVIRDAAVVVADGTIAWVGPADEAPDADERRDLAGRAVTPGFVDSHTHLVFAGDRSAEFAADGVYAFVAGEQKLASGLRRHLVERGIAKADITFTGYWRFGKSAPG